MVLRGMDLRGLIIDWKSNCTGVVQELKETPARPALDEGSLF